MYGRSSLQRGYVTINARLRSRLPHTTSRLIARPPTRSASLPTIGLVSVVLMLALFAVWSSNVATPINCRATPLALRLGTASESSMTVASGMSCAIIIHHGSATLEALSVETAPNHGNLSPRGHTGVNYRPMPGFAGEDFFAIALKGRLNSHEGTMVVRVRVAVQ
jgi:hypothetical protein